MESTLNAGFDRREMLELIWATRDDVLTPEQATRLDHLVCHNHLARDCYFDAVELLASLRWSVPAGEPTNLQAVLFGIEEVSGSQLAERDLLPTPQPSLQSRRPAANLARCIPAWSGFSVTSKAIAFAVSGLLVTYFSLLVLSIVWDQAHPADRKLGDQSNHEPRFATLVGAVECEWKGQAPAKAGEPLRCSTFELQKGVVALSFDDGAQVTLEGPAAFEIRSPNRGFLRRGKLVAMVPPKAIGFTIETPTATIVDLGTEFGVEVDPTGVTQAQVFRGAVKVKTISALSDEANDEQVVLQKNESVRIEKRVAGNQQTFTFRKVPPSGQFVRSLPTEKKPVPLLVLAHFRMGEDDLDAAANQPAAERTINHQRKQDLRRYGSPTYVNDAAPGSTLAVKFTGAPEEYFFQQNVQAGYDDEFILEAWVKPTRIEARSALIVYNGCGYTDGYGIALAGSRWSVPCGGPPVGGWMDSGIDCELGKWTHLALVCQYRTLQFWINGRLAKDFGETATVRAPSGAFTIGGAPETIGNVPNGFNGEIDEVRLSKFRAPFDPSMLLFRQSDAPGK
jgi:hypothetical protein